MLDSLCHKCCPSVPEGIIEIAADFDLTEEISKKEIERHIKYCGGKIDSLYKMPVVEES